MIGGLWGGNTHLHPEDVLGVVAFEQSPLGGLALEQVGAHSHLPTGDICPETFADPSEREVSTLPGTAGIVRRSALFTASFGTRMELPTYRGQWSQVELALDFQLENRDGGAA